jgi:hypothetical protein
MVKSRCGPVTVASGHCTTLLEPQLYFLVIAPNPGDHYARLRYEQNIN